MRVLYCDRSIRPVVQPLILLYTILVEKVPFFLPSIDKRYPFHIRSLERCPFQLLLNVHKSLNQIMFPWLFHSHKMGLSALIGPFTGRNDRFPYPYTSTTKSLPFHIPEAWKRYPFRAEPPRIGHYREYTGFGQKNMRRTRGRKEERGPSAPNSPPPSSYPSTLIWAPTVIHGKILLHGFGACV